MTGSRRDVQSEFRALITSLERYRAEETAQAQLELDERRRAWHDGRASAYADVIEQLGVMLTSGAGDGQRPTN